MYRSCFSIVDLAFGWSSRLAKMINLRLFQDPFVYTFFFYSNLVNKNLCFSTLLVVLKEGNFMFGYTAKMFACLSLVIYKKFKISKCNHSQETQVQYCISIIFASKSS